jgi:hypothetical protein
VSPEPHNGRRRHDDQDAREDHQRNDRRLDAGQVRPGQDRAVDDAVGPAGQEPAQEREGLPPPAKEQQAGVRDHRQDVARSVDAHQQGQAESEAAEPGADPGAKTIGVERVDDQAEPAEEQDLRERLAVGRPAGELLRQRDREHEGRERGPPWPDQPSSQPAEGQHCARADDGAHGHRRRHPAGPEPRGQDHRQSRHELRHDCAAALVEGETLEREHVAGAAECAAVLRDRQRPVMGDPVRELDVRRGIASHDDELRVVDELIGAERDRHRDHGGHRPPRRTRLLSLPRRLGTLPPAWDPAPAHHHEPDRGRHRQHYHEHRGEGPREQQRQPDQQPGHDQQGWQHG